jgi:hypothetical protein
VLGAREALRRCGDPERSRDGCEQQNEATHGRQG